MSKNQNAHSLDSAQQARRHRMSVVAQAPAARLLALWTAWTQRYGAPVHDILRAPDIGTVMVRGRAGAVGAPFNLGEITVTRCSVRLAGGTVGHGYVQGRDKQASLAAGLIDALALGDLSAAIDEEIIDRLQLEASALQATRAAKAAATKVDFFTLVRGD